VEKLYLQRSSNKMMVSSGGLVVWVVKLFLLNFKWETLILGGLLLSLGLILILIPVVCTLNETRHSFVI
jgi:hypothetical protein